MKLNELMPLDDLFEMANLEPQKTGVTGFIYISTAQASHAPRIKYYPKLGKRAPHFVVTISDTPDVVKVIGMKQPDVDALKLAVFKFVTLNKEKLLDFWHNGTDWPSDDVTAFLNSFSKVAS